MNYYPYYMMGPMAPVRPGLFASLRNAFRGIDFASILNGTQRTLNVVNQAIPLVKQVSPVMKNARTMFKVMNEFKKTDVPARKKQNDNYSNAGHVSDKSYVEYEDGPKFFI